MTAENPLLQLATWYGYVALALTLAAGAIFVLRDLDGVYRRRAQWTSMVEIFAAAGAMLGAAALALWWAAL